MAARWSSLAWVWMPPGMTTGIWWRRTLPCCRSRSCGAGGDKPGTRVAPTAAIVRRRNVAAERPVVRDAHHRVREFPGCCDREAADRCAQPDSHRHPAEERGSNGSSRSCGRVPSCLPRRAYSCRGSWPAAQPACPSSRCNTASCIAATLAIRTSVTRSSSFPIAHSCTATTSGASLSTSSHMSRRKSRCPDRPARPRCNGSPATR